MYSALRRATACGLLSIVFAPISGLAAESGYTEIPSIIVSGTRSMQSAVTTPSSITIISRDQIEASGASHITEVLRNQAGVQLYDLYGDGSRATVSMRGFSGGNAASNSLILLDGRRLNNTDLGAPDLNSIALQDVERVEIIQGSAGTLFGDQAVGGVVNIITRAPRILAAHAEVGLGSFHSHSARANVSDNAGNGLAYRLSAETRRSDNYREHNGQDYANVFGRLDYRHGNGLLFAELQHVDEEIDFPGALSAAQVAADRRQPGTPSDYNDTETTIARIGIKHALTPSWQLEAELSERDSDGTGSFYGSAFNQDRQHTDLTPRLIGTLNGTHGDVLLTLGADLDDTDYDYASPFGSTHNEQQTQSWYAQAVLPLSDSVSATIGARHARVENHVIDTSAFPAGRDLDDHVSVAELGLSAQVHRDLRLFLRRDGNFRFAKVDENTYTSPGVVGLDTQKGVSYEAGAEWARDGASANVVVYRLDLDNEIAFDSTAPDPFGGVTGANVNLDPTQRNGVIAELHHEPTPRFTLSGQYSYIDASFDSGSFAGKRVPFVAKHALRASAGYRANRAWKLFAELLYTGERFQDSDYANALDKLPAIAVLNLNARYRVKHWTFSARINNVMDKKYSDYATSSYYYPAPERNFRFALRYEFN